MATAKSDDESDAASHPLAENRPGVYVQVVSPRRRKKGKRGDASASSNPPARAEARSPARQGKARGGVREETDARVTAREGSDPRAEAESDVSSAPSEKRGASKKVSQAPARLEKSEVEVEAQRATLASEPAVSTTAAATAGESELDDEDDGRQSGERPVDFESIRARETESENTNDRPDLLGLSLPPPPRLPSFSSPIKPQREIETDPPAHSASLLDAPHSLRPVAESTPAARSSNTLLAFVGAFTAIIVMAGLVALRDVTKSKPAASAQPSVNHAPVGSSPASVSAPRVETLAPSAQPTPAAAASQAAPSPRPALPLPLDQGKLAAKAARSAARQPAAKALVAKATAALRNLKNTGAQATPGAVSEEPEAAEDEDRVPGPDEPLELPVNPYR